MKHVTSRDNAYFKQLRALVEDAREQRQRQQTLLDGVHLIDAFHQASGVPVELLLAESAQQTPEIQALLQRFPDVPQILLRDSLFRELSGVASPVGIAAVIAIPSAPPDHATTSCICLDAVQDAGNVGSILRTAAAAGVREIYLGKGCAGVWTPRVLRSAQGAHFSLRIREQVDLLALTPTLPMPAAATVAHQGTSLYQSDLRGPIAWILGNEGNGVSASLIAAAKLRVTIPLVEAESLNVAAAAAVCLFEARRQQLAMAS